MIKDFDKPAAETRRAARRGWSYGGPVSHHNSWRIAGVQLGDLNVEKLIPAWNWEWKPHKDDTSNVERFAWVSRDLDVSVHNSDGRFRYRTDVNIQGIIIPEEKVKDGN